MNRKNKGDASGEERRASLRDAYPPGVISVAFEKLFGGGRGVRRLSRTNLRYVEMERGAILVEQNPDGADEWAEAARGGRRVAWLLRDGERLARVVDGVVERLF